MTIFRWSKNLETGMPLIDGQHKRLIEAANTFVVQFHSGASPADISSCLAFLDEYTQYHFACEEKIQQQFGYKELDKHVALHRAFENQLHLHRTRLESTNFAPAEVNAFYDTLIAWLKNHVMDADAAFAAECLHKKPIKINN